ncbi:MAG: hypothetical protein Q4G09_00885 [Clostridia bacterium]|nr:hypothetical protein [Clostridia bacterium]
MKLKLYVPFVGYNKNSKIPTLSLNATNNKYCCFRCGAGGFSIGLYAKVKDIDTKEAFKELLARECFSTDKSHIAISPINEIADIETRNVVYSTFLNMLKLENNHKQYLEEQGFLQCSISEQQYKSIPKKYIKRRLVCSCLSRKFNLAGIPGFYQEEDFKWNFIAPRGFFIPVFDKNNMIQGLSIHLDKSFNNCTDIWFSSTDKINGTGAKNWIIKNNINNETTSVILTDNLLLGNLIKEILNVPIIAFSSISNSYIILKEIEETNIERIIFTIRPKEKSQNFDYIIQRVFKDLLPLGYNLDVKYVNDYTDILKDNFCESLMLKIAK